MDSKQIDKNILDLEYSHELQTYGAVLIAMTTGILGFFGTFIWSPSNMGVGIAIIAFFETVLIAWLIKVKKRMRNIINKLNGLKG